MSDKPVYKLLNVANDEAKQIMDEYKTMWLKSLDDIKDSRVVQPDSTNEIEFTIDNILNEFNDESTQIKASCEMYALDHNLATYLLAVTKRIN